MSHILVTGGAGFIGSHVVDTLLEAGHEVSVIDDFSSGREVNLIHHREHPRLTIHRRSICDDCSSIFEQSHIDAVVHLAARPGVQYSIKHPLDAHHINVNGTVYLLELARKFGVKRFVFTSSSSVYGNQDTLPVVEDMTPNPLSPYAVQKLIGEHYCQLYRDLHGFETIMVRPFNVYGPRQDPAGDYAAVVPKFVQLVNSNQQPLINGNGKQTRDFTFVTDVARLFLVAVQADNKSCFGEAFNAGAGNNISVNSIAQQIIDLSNKSIIPQHGPAVVEARDSLADTTKALGLLSWRPEVPFQQGILETYKFFSKL